MFSMILGGSWNSFKRSQWPLEMMSLILEHNSCLLRGPSMHSLKVWRLGIQLDCHKFRFEFLLGCQVMPLEHIDHPLSMFFQMKEILVEVLFLVYLRMITLHQRTVGLVIILHARLLRARNFLVLASFMSNPPFSLLLVTIFQFT